MNSEPRPTPSPAEIRRQGNRLKDEPSLYLRQHAHNPIDWYPWGDEALTRARHEDRPIFLSIGYSSCHWCHVMEHEVFEQDDVARFMNAHFVNIKVDREERPDLDAVYMEAVQMMTGRGGWPMSVFLTPDLNPFFGGTYFPRVQFLSLTSQIVEIFRERRDELEAQATELAAGIAGLEGSFAAGDVVSLTCGGRPAFARGLVNYPATELSRITGLRTERIADVLGYCPYDEVIHRDNLAVISRD